MAGFDFRDSAGYVTDPAGHTYVLADTYPTVRAGFTFGYISTSGINTRDRPVTTPPELAGEHFINNNQVFKAIFVYECGNGTFDVSLASGPKLATSSAYVELVALDSSNVVQSVLSTVANGTSLSPAEFVDATGVVRTSEADWDANQATTQVVLSGASVRIGVRIGAGDGVTGLATHLNHFSVESAAPAFSITDIDGDNDVQAGQTGAIITTTGIDPASVTQATTLGGETITINTWS